MSDNPLVAVQVPMIIGLCVVPIIGVFIPFLMQMIPQRRQNAKERASASKQKVDEDCIKVMRELAKYFSYIKGNEEAKAKIIDSILGWLGSKKSCTEHKTGGLVLYIVGPSGVGKSMAANAICKALLGPDATPFRISLSSIDSQSNLSVAEQLTAPKRVPAWGVQTITVNTPFVCQLQNNPRTVIWIDEYDKLSAKDHTLDDLIWDIRDSGQLIIDGKVIDCSNAVFVVTSNEDPEEFWGISGGEKDDTATSVNHNTAFKCRVTPIVFKFPDVTSYKDVLEATLGEMIKSYKDRFNVHCHISDSDIGLAAQDAKDEHGGIRKTQDYAISFAGVLEKYRVENNITTKSSSAKDLYISYSRPTKSFVVY